VVFGKKSQSFCPWMAFGGLTQTGARRRWLQFDRAGVRLQAFAFTDSAFARAGARKAARGQKCAQLVIFRFTNLGKMLVDTRAGLFEDALSDPGVRSRLRMGRTD
jgi:hypothetical protein